MKYQVLLVLVSWPELPFREQATVWRLLDTRAVNFAINEPSQSCAHCRAFSAYSDFLPSYSTMKRNAYHTVFVQKWLQ